MTSLSLLTLSPVLKTLFDEDPLFQSYQDDNGTFHFYVIEKEPNEGFVCPHCGSSLSKPHGYSTRCCQLFPIEGHTTYLHIRQPRRECLNPNCAACTFIMDIPHFRFFQRRADDLNELILVLSIFCNDKDAELICQRIGIEISHDSINRLLSHISITDDPDIETIGVDDVALKKGKTYSTAIYAGQDHHLIALLKGRDGKEFKEWLKTHKKVKFVARDRATAYASAIEEVFSDCTQVADRFHLFQNLLDRFKAVFKEEIPATLPDHYEGSEVENLEVENREVEKEIINTLNYDNTPPVDENGNRIQFIDKGKIRDGKQYIQQKEKRKKKHIMVCDLRKEWESKSFKTKKEKKEFKTYLSNKYEISEASVEKYLKMTEEEVEKLLNITVYKKRETSVKDYLNMIFKMLKDKIPPETIYDYILSQGYKGSRSCLESHIRAISINNNLGFIPSYFSVRHSKTNKRKNLITRSDILKYMTIKDKRRMNKTKVAQCYDQILKEYPILKYLDTVWNDFHETLMGNDVGRLVEFINKYEKSQISEINQFIRGIKKDIAPVKK